MLPTPGDLYVSEALTNMSVAYMEQEPYVADQVFPLVPHDVQAGKYFIYRRGDWFRAEAKPRAPGTESAGSGWRVTTADFFMEQYAFHTDVNDTQRANARSQFRLEQNSTNFVTRNMLLTREYHWASKYFTNTPWATTVTGVASGPTGPQVVKWSAAGSTPIKDIQTWSLYMQQRTGYKPNVLVVGPEVELDLLQHPDLIERIKYTQRGVITRDLIASMLGVEKFLVPSAVVNIGPETENEASDNFQFIFGDDALLAYSAPSPGLEVASAGYTFGWTGLFGASAFGSRIKKFRMENIASDRIEGEMGYDMKVVAPELGIFFSDLVD